MFVALGGASYAAVKLPTNSVGNRQLKKNAVTSSKVKDRSLRAVDFARGQLPAGPKGDAGPAGPKGDRGDKGDKGDKGDPGPTAGGWAHSTGGNQIARYAYTPVIDLVSVPNTGSLEAHSGGITVAFRARLIATATLVVRNNSGSNAAVGCQLILRPSTGGTTSFYYWGANIPAPVAQDSPGTLTDGIDVDPGTYNVSLDCYTYGTDNIYARGQTLTVVAVAR